jgi:hypothetical protein
MNSKPQGADEERLVTIREEVYWALLKIAGRQIDPETADVYWYHGQVGDPYGIYPDPPPEGRCVGRLYFAQNPGSDIWIHFGDLPDATARVLRDKPVDDWIPE